MKKILLYIFSVVLTVYLANFCYVSAGLYNEDIKKCGAEFLYSLDSALATNNVLYFSESSDFTYHPKDSCKKSISQLLNELNTNYKIKAISKGASHAAVFKNLIKRVESGSSIKVIIVTVNLRSFGINWIESDLESNISRANVFYSTTPPIIKKFLLSFKAYDNAESIIRKRRIKWHYKHDRFQLVNKPFTTIREWDKKVFGEGFRDQNGNRNEEKTSLACHFIKNYAFTLNENNPRIKDLDAIVEHCTKNNIRLIFNVLPENFEKAEQFYGLDLITLMKNNVSFLEKRYGKTTKFINNSEILRDSCFIDRDWPSEHYNFNGRFAVAKNINEQLKIVLSP